MSSIGLIMLKAGIVLSGSTIETDALDLTQNVPTTVVARACEDSADAEISVRPEGNGHGLDWPALVAKGRCGVATLTGRPLHVSAICGAFKPGDSDDGLPHIIAFELDPSIIAGAASPNPCIVYIISTKPLKRAK